MEKSDIQKEWDKLPKEGKLIKILVMKRKKCDQLENLAVEDYDSKRHVAIGWVQDSIRWILIRDIHSGHLYRFMIFKYVAAVAKVNPNLFSEAQWSLMEKNTINSIPQIFTE